MHVEATPLLAEVGAGSSTTFNVTITNTTERIDAYTVSAFGLDRQWVEVTPRRLSLFPSETRDVTVTVALPADFPAGQRQLAMQIQSANDAAEFSFTQMTLDVGTRSRTSLRIDPSTVTGGSTAQFSLIVTNEGNDTIDAQPEAVDPEDETSIAFEPRSVAVPPQQREVIRAEVTGSRPWFGQPKPRILEFQLSGATSAMATFVQKPRVGRLLITLLGLITVAAVFAAVLSRVVDSVVDEASVDDDLLNEALDERGDEVESVPVNPASITGRVVLAGSGAGVGGVQAELYTSGNDEVPVGSAATDPDGTYTFGGLSSGSFRIELTAAGFAPRWYPAAPTFGDADDVEVEAGDDVELDDAAVVGEPGSVAGSLTLDDPTGATARLVAAGTADPGTPALVSEVDVSADGAFLLEDVPSPATYQLLVEKPGFETEVRDIVLRAAQELEGIEISLREGGGTIAGHVEQPSGPLGGATVTATDGSTTISTASLTLDDVGFFAIRGLPTPGRYSVTFERDGYTSETRSIELGSAQEIDDMSVTLVPTTGSIAGVVSQGDNGPVGGVAVTISGGDVEMSTTTTSQGSTGSYLFQGLPAPATYNITFSKDGLESQSRLEHLDPASGQRELTGIDANLAPSDATVRGVIRNSSGAAVGGARVELTDGEEGRTLRTAHEPSGRFEFSDVDPGTYTFRAELPGSAPEVMLVNVLPADVEDLDITLGRQAALSGQVLVRNDEIDELVPYSGATVRLFAPGSFPGTATAAVASTTTDGNGNYSFPNLPAPEDFIIAVYATDSSSDALDSELVATAPGTAVVVPTFELAERS